MKPTLQDLSSREAQTLALAAKGLTDKEVAVRFGVSLSTVRTYWERLFHKLGAVNRAQAVAICFQGKADEVPAITEQPPEPDTLLQAAVDSALGGVLVIDADRTVIAANEKAGALLNRPLESVRGQHLDVIVPRRYMPFHRVLEAAISETTQSVYTVSTFVHVLGGPDFLCDVTIRTLDGPEGRHTALFIRDAVADIDARRRGRSASF